MQALTTACARRTSSTICVSRISNHLCVAIAIERWICFRDCSGRFNISSRLWTWISGNPSGGFGFTDQSYSFGTPFVPVSALRRRFRLLVESMTTESRSLFSPVATSSLACLLACLLDCLIAGAACRLRRICRPSATDTRWCGPRRTSSCSLEALISIGTPSTTWCELACSFSHPFTHTCAVWLCSGRTNRAPTCGRYVLSLDAYLPVSLYALFPRSEPVRHNGLRSRHIRRARRSVGEQRDSKIGRAHV